MLMVCPNCHSDQIIAVQDQHFCINCGQMVPEDVVAKAKPKVALQANGLPEGVKILPVAGAPDVPEPKVDAVETKPALVETATTPAPPPTPSLIHARPRLER